jgi:tetratricopeptide (TPR) repeat protein
MKNVALLFQFGALCVAAFLLAGGSELRAQPSAENPPVKSPSLQALNEAELLRAYLQVRDQYHSTQLAIANSRAEAEASARLQATAINEKLEAIKSAIEAERERMQAETLRANGERERQQSEMQRANRTVLWVAVGFGTIGLLAMLFMPLVQLRTINRIAESANQRLPFPPQGLLTSDSDGLASQTVARSNQRLMSVIERMEKRIFELEQTATPPLPAATTLEVKTTNGSHHPMPATTVPDHATVITVLLGKGKFLLGTNKAKEALACYEEVLKIDADHAEALVKKGAALERLKQDDAAIRCYDRALEVNRNMTLAYLSKAGACNRLGRYDEAMECYELALQTEEERK